MPDHLHGIVVYKSEQRTGKIKPLGRLIGAFKTVSTKRMNMAENTPGHRIWQRDFYDHIVRDENDLDRIRWYIKNNPRNWGK